MSRTFHIQRKELLSGAREATGIAVVIDVYRAFTCAALMMHLGAEQIVLHGDPKAILKLKLQKGYLAVGEVGGKIVDGFDLGNSPTRILAAGRQTFAGRTVAQRTSAGVTGAMAASYQADAVILGSYVTAGAIARYIHRMSPPPTVVSLVAMGADGKRPTPEDQVCGDYIEHLLTGRAYDHVAALRQTIEHESTQKFLRGQHEHLPPTDPLYCLQRDVFDFCIVGTRENEGRDAQLVARRVDVLAK